MIFCRKIQSLKMFLENTLVKSSGDLQTENYHPMSRSVVLKITNAKTVAFLLAS